MADRLFGVQRHERLLSELRRSGSVRVAALARELGVSELTIRRDIAALASRNLVTRVHGGATLPRDAPRAARPARTRFTVGMVVPSLDFSWPPIVAGARAAAAALGVTLRLRGSAGDPEEDRRQITGLAGEVHGLLLAPALDAAMAGWIGRLPVPAVLVEREPSRWTATPRQLEWVRCDHALGAEIAVHHLHERGHRRIGLALGSDASHASHAPDTPGTPSSPHTPHAPGTPSSPHTPHAPGTPSSPHTPHAPGTPSSPHTPHAPGTPSSPHTPHAPGTPGTPGTPHTPGTPGTPHAPDAPAGQLRAGWRAACAELGVDGPILAGGTVRDLLAEVRRAGLTALVVHGEPDAAAVARGCAEHGVVIPGDLALIAYDDDTAHLAEPALTAVRPPRHHVGRLAVELIVSRLLDGDRRPSQRVLVAPELVERHSSRAVRF
ncbi:substrate-binding domain-containing protein [Dactylosporangium sp. CS-033363]|uniref:substrate-binding domain-containing protein n=1 Tax=Dactylosporangium sp. CS-033363 TaxID=3239935 RepID=UPI003D94F7FB